MTLVCVAAKTLAITHKHANFCLSANRRTRIKYNIHRNKCIEDDTKPAARQSPNCIKKTNNMANNDFRYGAWNSYTLQCDTIMTLISPGGSTLQCDTWLGNDMPLNSPKRPPYWNSTSGFDFDRPYHCNRHVLLHQSAKFYPNRTTLGRKKWRDVDFQDGGCPPSWILGVQ